MKLKMNYFF